MKCSLKMQLWHQKVLEIALTGKACGLEERAPMCGSTISRANAYISKLVEKDTK